MMNTTTRTATRDWATPLTIGTFALMGVTGVLLFFHLDRGMQKFVHEWGGWLMVAAVVVHSVVNWASFKRYLRRPSKGPVVIGLCLLVLVGSSFLQPAAKGASPSSIAMKAVANAPLATVAALFGKPAEQARADLAAAGIALPDTNASIHSVVGDDRERLGAALKAMARAPR